MNECRHNTDLDEYGCMNCDNDFIEFEKWWKNDSGWPRNSLAEYGLAKAAWFRAIQHVVDDHSLGL